MARGALLSSLRSKVRAQILQTANTAIATNADTTINTLLSTAQSLYSTIRDWPFLVRRWDVAVAAGARYLAFPTVDTRGNASTINTERPYMASVLFNTLWIDLDYGIGDEEFSHRDSDLGQAEDPVQRWDYSTDIDEATNSDQFEVWPIPVTPQKIRFKGQRQPYALVADSDKADLDDLLLVFTVAAEWLLTVNPAMSQFNQTLAQQRLNFLTSAYPNRTEKLILGANTINQPNLRRLVPIITIK